MMYGKEIENISTGTAVIALGMGVATILGSSEPPKLKRVCGFARYTQEISPSIPKGLSKDFIKPIEDEVSQVINRIDATVAEFANSEEPISDAATAKAKALLSEAAKHPHVVIPNEIGIGGDSEEIGIEWRIGDRVLRLTSYSGSKLSTLRYWIRGTKPLDFQEQNLESALDLATKFEWLRAALEEPLLRYAANG